MEEHKKCKRNGCKKQFKESENTSDACKFHPGKPLFHDLKKGWTCCNVESSFYLKFKKQVIVYDWDEFEKIPTCAVG